MFLRKRDTIIPKQHHLRSIARKVALCSQIQKRFAGKAAGGKTKNGRDSQPKYLGLKKGNRQFVKTGQIIVRQRGSTFRPGPNVGQGRDFTLYARAPGYVSFFRAHSPLAKKKNIFITQKFVQVVTEKPNQVKQDIR